MTQGCKVSRARKVAKVPEEKLVHQDHQETLDHLVQLDLVGSQDHKDHKV